MDLKGALVRARRGAREDIGLHVVAVSTLAVGFLCLGTALIAVRNLGGIADQLGRNQRVSIYLKDGAAPGEVSRLREALALYEGVRSVEYVSPEVAKSRFLADSRMRSELGGLPDEAFPGSLEVALEAAVSSRSIERMTRKVRGFQLVEGVESYEGWFDRIEALLTTGQRAAYGLALFVALGTFAVVGNTIRLALARRREEIQVMKLCGATDGFVRGPFVIEGAIQGAVAAIVALALLGVGFAVFRVEIDATFAALLQTRLLFLTPGASLVLLVTGGVAGALGSLLSLRRYLRV